MTTKIIQMRMEDSLVQALDDLASEQRSTRAEIVRKACKYYLRHLQKDKLERSYLEGYAHIPEDRALGQSQIAALGKVLSREVW